MSAECFCGDAGGSLVAVDSAGHDVAGIPELWRASGLVRRNRDEHFGRSSEEADRSWNPRYRTRPIGWAKADLRAYPQGNRPGTGAHGNGSVGRPARRNGKPSACPADAKGQGAISGIRATTLGSTRERGRPPAEFFPTCLSFEKIKLRPSPVATHHSWRNALIGSSCAARRARTYVANIATTTIAVGTMRYSTGLRRRSAYKTASEIF